MCKYFIGKDKCQARIADEDINVLKAVVLEDSGKKWRGVYQTEFVADTNKLLKADGVNVYKPNDDDWMCVEGGCFHSCASLNDFRLRNHELEGVTIVKAIIPKGTIYYRSKVSNDICSEKIIVTDSVVVKPGEYAKHELDKLEVIEIVKSEGRKWLHIKDSEHEVFISTETEGECNWHEAVEYCENNGVGLPSTDDWDLVIKYYYEINKFCEDNGIEGFECGWYWSSGEFNASNAWCFYGVYGVLGGYNKYNTFSVRPVLKFNTCSVRPILVQKVKEMGV